MTIKVTRKENGYLKPVFIPGVDAPQERRVHTEILGLEDIATALKLSPQTVVKYIHQEGLPARKVGKQYFTTVTRLQNWINEQD